VEESGWISTLRLASWVAMKVLVAYSFKRGSTAEIAEAIAGTLRDAGLEVDCAEGGDAARVSRPARLGPDPRLGRGHRFRSCAPACRPLSSRYAALGGGFSSSL
jgi:hypothetical protein